MKQEELKSNGWKKVENDEADDAEQVKLEVGESLEGMLLDKFEFDSNFGKKNWGYIVKVKDRSKPSLLFGCSWLNKNMMDVSVGDAVLIERLVDKKNKQGMSYQVFDVYYK